ncbi:hypothetical protein [Ensifer adhaerens]|jgi:hypothetical protein|uniref:hypothetical protein n=1 Tax=Ensifer adhaerens TaxID=106592 RepID=UPI00095FB312|nr:hypothetical protein [Ensifer adhaerens]OKP73713.1 hypothetical protein BTE77_22415 [Ensifer adhaerens]
MYEQYRYGGPPKKFSTGFLIGVMLLAMLVIGGYLVVNSALSHEPQQSVAIVLPFGHPRSSFRLKQENSHETDALRANPP